MLGRLIAFLRSIFRGVVKIAKWPLNPTNGKGQYVTPLRRHFISGELNLVVSVGYRLGQALVALGKSIVFDVVAPFVDAVIGVASDLYHSNTNYTRMGIQCGLSAVQAVLSVVVVVAMFVIGLFQK